MGIKEGDTVVYSKTGTKGRISRLVELEGKLWAELDTTGLLYDENALEVVEVEDTPKEGWTEASRPKKEREQENVREEELKGGDMTIDTSGSCSGAG
ncbi:MAG: DUF2098 family protein [Candidatus Verstraetearchaeota archaeon]|nr:DUF2098 family protein [Candidatus Verstraetearchaeota archaeon]